MAKVEEKRHAVHRIRQAVLQHCCQQIAFTHSVSVMGVLCFVADGNEELEVVVKLQRTVYKDGSESVSNFTESPPGDGVVSVDAVPICEIPSTVELPVFQQNSGQNNDKSVAAAAPYFISIEAQDEQITRKAKPSQHEFKPQLVRQKDVRFTSSGSHRFTERRRSSSVGVCLNSTDDENQQLGVSAEVISAVVEDKENTVKRPRSSNSDLQSVKQPRCGDLPSAVGICLKYTAEEQIQLEQGAFARAMQRLRHCRPEHVAPSASILRDGGFLVPPPRTRHHRAYRHRSKSSGEAGDVSSRLSGAVARDVNVAPVDVCRTLVKLVEVGGSTLESGTSAVVANPSSPTADESPPLLAASVDRDTTVRCLPGEQGMKLNTVSTTHARLQSGTTLTVQDTHLNTKSNVVLCYANVGCEPPEVTSGAVIGVVRPIFDSIDVPDSGNAIDKESAIDNAECCTEGLQMTIPDSMAEPAEVITPTIASQAQPTDTGLPPLCPVVPIKTEPTDETTSRSSFPPLGNNSYRVVGTMYSADAWEDLDVLEHKPLMMDIASKSCPAPLLLQPDGTNINVEIESQPVGIHIPNSIPNVAPRGKTGHVRWKKEANFTCGKAPLGTILPVRPSAFRLVSSSNTDPVSVLKLTASPLTPRAAPNQSAEVRGPLAASKRQIEEERGAFAWSRLLHQSLKGPKRSKSGSRSVRKRS